MRDAMTSLGAFLILIVLLSGIYAAWDISHSAPTAASTVSIAQVGDYLDRLLGSGRTPELPPPTLPKSTSTVATTSSPRPSPTPTPTAVISPTPTPTLPPPPPTPKPVDTPTPVPTPTPISPYPYVLDGRITHDNACPGEYIIGYVRDAQGRPLPGVTVRMEDEYGNGDTRVTKANPDEIGRYEFVITGPARRIYVWIVDEGGRPLSPRVEIAHRLPQSGYETFRCHYVNWKKNE